MIDGASLAEWAKEQPMKNYKFAICERDNNNRTPHGKLLQYNAYMYVCSLLFRCAVHTLRYIHIKTSLLSLLSETIKRVSPTVTSRAVHLLQLQSASLIQRLT